MEREKGTLDQDEDEDEDEDEDDLCVGERLGFSDQSNGSKERDLVDQLGADSNMKEDKVTSEKWRADSTLSSSDSIMEECLVPPEGWPTAMVPAVKLSMAPAMADVNMAGEWATHVERNISSISSEQDLQHSEILCQVSPRKNTCLHIAASFGHHDLAKYIVKECPDLIKNKNSKGDTALHIAARKRNLSFVKIVMDSCPSGSGASQDVEKAEPSLLELSTKKEIQCCMRH
ncbi:hypothetical protein CK203_004447 [Vitis vinifera]|uniref:Uncharacterized protein n=1 Tax=Vitis vinifera TaxID=29760 RepID=A0A438KGE2_VITVI|nr:hypothetical protein CK203_004447 [Vitis vinifera]